jgi:signal transduction histidine kinase/ActR/RegA family two-component response regulator
MRLAIRLEQLRDVLIPEQLRGQEPSLRRERLRIRWMIDMLMVVLVACLGSMLLAMARGAWGSSLSGLIGGLFPVGMLLCVRRGFTFKGPWIAAAIGLGSLYTAGAIMAAGRDGLTMLCWLTFAPPLTSSLTGPRWATVVLALNAVLVAAALSVVCLVDYQPLIHLSLGNQLMTALSALVAFFANVRAYESGLAHDLSELEQRNSELASARETSDAANRAKSDFLAVMSHEIRTPLNGVLGMTSVMLAEQGLPSGIRDDLGIIQHSGATLLAVLNDILDFSKIESGQLRLERVPVNLRSELSAVRALFERLASERGNALVIEVGPEVPAFILEDPVRLRQVTLNLVSNALKFTSAGTVKLEARVADGALTLCVRDTGIGMTDEVLRRLFTPFMQADASTTRRFGGTGLGLAIVQRLASAMGGAVRATSTPGVGSCFSFCLPCVPTAAPAKLEAELGPVTRSLRVLVVEDNPINQRVAMRLIGQLGHEVVLACNGAEALIELAGSSFDAVLMDCYMPVMDGFEATRAARAMAMKQPVIFALTASSLPEDHARCLASGMDGVLNKPVQRADLVRAFAQFGQRSGASPARALALVRASTLPL